jgi:xanthine/CO dehydrogenase XdhC/CoxF family maturation factor
MLVWPDGHTQGTVGGATPEKRVIEDAIEALTSRPSRLERSTFRLDEDPESVGLCGGAVEVHSGVIEPEAKLDIIGSGHVARQLARLRAPIGLGLGAETPGEIGLSIPAVIMQVRRDASGRPLSEIPRQAAATQGGAEFD